LAEWLHNNGHDVIDIHTLGPDPGNRALLERAESENRVLITTDKDFGELIHLHGIPHSGLIRLPDVRMAQRIALVEQVINHHGQALEERAIVTVRGNRMRISHPPAT
jgi:predicted nuclease of predicted toxin-antitoxin system